MAIETSLLSLSPKITAKEHRLIVTTSWPSRILTLGLSLRQLVVDRYFKTITFDHRRAWFWKSRINFHFSDIESVTYGYDDVSPGSSFLATHDSVDRFVVGLKPFGGEEVLLFNLV